MSLKHEQCFTFHAEHSDVRKCLKEGHRVMILLRGVTGSGKTTLAHELVAYSKDCGFKSTRVADDTGTNQLSKLVRNALHSDFHLIVVDNESVERLDIKKLAELGINEKYEFFLVEPDTAWKYDAEECQKKSTRDEDIESITRKIQSIENTSIGWKHLITGTGIQIIINNYHDDYSPLTPPEGSPVGSPNLSSRLASPAPTMHPKEKLFSLAPVTKTKVMKTVSTNVTLECLAHELAYAGSVKDCEYSLEEEKAVKVVEKSTKQTCERKVQTEDIKIAVNGEINFSPVYLLSGGEEQVGFSLLCNVFPQVETTIIRHYIKVNGYAGTFKMLKVIGEKAMNPSKIDECGVLFDDIEWEESFTMYADTMEEELEERKNEREEFFKSHYDISIQDDCENDESIVLAIKEDYESQSRSIDEKVDFISKLFPRAPREMILYFCEIAHETDLVCEMLREQNHHEVVPSARIPTWSDTAAAIVNKSRPTVKKTEKEENNHFLKQNKEQSRRSLESAQEYVITARRKMEMDRLANTSYNSPANSEFRNTVLTERRSCSRRNITEKVLEIDKRIRDAHDNPYCLDLHYMSVEGAENFVREAIDAVRYFIRTRSKPERRIKVVTGSGNNSKNGAAKIKPKIVALLKKENISFNEMNEGCIELKL